MKLNSISPFQPFIGNIVENEASVHAHPGSYDPLLRRGVDDYNESTNCPTSSSSIDRHAQEQVATKNNEDINTSPSPNFDKPEFTSTDNLYNLFHTPVNIDDEAVSQNSDRSMPRVIPQARQRKMNISMKASVARTLRLRPRRFKTVRQRRLL